MDMFKRMILPIAALLVLGACNVTRVVKPLEKGEHQVSASLGGPAIVFSGAPLPIPLSSVAYAHGLDTGLSVSAGLHTTSLLFGVAQVDASLHARLWQAKNNRFGLTMSPGAHFFYDFNEQNTRVYPQVDLGAWWQYSKDKDHLLYGGVGSWFELYREKAHGQVQDHEVLPYVTLGHQFRWDTWSFQVEARYLGMFYRNDELVVTYLTPFNTGTSGLYFGIGKSFGK